MRANEGNFLRRHLFERRLVRLNAGGHFIAGDGTGENNLVHELSPASALNREGGDPGVIRTRDPQFRKLMLVCFRQ